MFDVYLWCIRCQQPISKQYSNITSFYGQIAMFEANCYVCGSTHDYIAIKVIESKKEDIIVDSKHPSISAQDS